MKAFVCEMCHGNQLIKQDGLYICQFCGTKYSAEEARKLIIEGPIKIDYSEEIAKLYEVARRAKNTGNSEHAQKFYEKILVKDPSSWEANFYAVYYQSVNSKVGEISIAASRITNLESDVLQLLKDSSPDKAVWKAAVKEISESLVALSDLLFQAAKEHYHDIAYQIRPRYSQEYMRNCNAAREILYTFSDLLITMFKEPSIKRFAIPCLEKGFEQHRYILMYFNDKKTLRRVTKEYQAKIQALRTSLQSNKTSNFTNKTNSVHTPITVVEIIKIFQTNLRREMKIYALVCACLGVLFTLISAWKTAGLFFVLPSFILCVMFLVLGISPKKSRFLFGRKDCMSKNMFILICAVACFWCVVVVAFSLAQTSIQ